MSIYQRIKQWLRRNKKIISLASFFLILATLFAGYWLTNTTYWSNDEEAIDVLANQPISVILKTRYLCGMETETKEFEGMEEVEKWLSAQEEWTIKESNAREVTLIREKLDDLSPMCKSQGYFGLLPDGTLTLFQGPPAENQIIQTFFRIDTELLESRLPKKEMGELQHGIRFQNVAEYLSILSTYSEFAAE